MANAVSYLWPVPASGGGGGGAGALLAANNLSDLASIPTAVANLGIAATASWAIGVTRVYAIDPVNGNDASAGFATAATTSTADYAVACAAAGAVARKTLAGLGAIFPRFGNGRTVEIVIANGGVNTQVTITEALATLVGGTTEYAAIDVRATGTSTTAGCTAFDGSSADCTYLGAVTAPGMNVSGYNPTGTPTTTLIQCVLAGGGAPAFGAEPAAPCGYRIRFDAVTTTAALRGVTGFVTKVSGTDTLALVAALPAVPVGADVFYIEQVGVLLQTFVWAGYTSSNAALATIAGIGSSAGITLTDGRYRPAFVQSTGGSISCSFCPQIAIGPAYAHVARGAITCGGVRSSTSGSFTNSGVILSGLVTGTGCTITNPVTMSITTGLTVGSGNLIFSNCLQLPSSGGTGGGVFDVGGSGAVVSVPVRTINGSVQFTGGGTIRIAQISVTSTTAGSAALLADGRWTINLAGPGANTSITGSGAGSSFGFAWFGQGLIPFSSPQQSSVMLDPAHLPTLTGGLGDVATGNGGPVSWTAAAAGYIDFNGIRYSGTTTLRPQFMFSGTLFGGAGATSTYLANGGDGLATNNATPLQYPVGAGQSSQTISVKPRTNTMANACTVTLYKNGVATASTVTIPAGSTLAVLGGSALQWTSTDVMDVRIDNASADATHQLSVAVAVMVGA